MTTLITNIQQLINTREEMTLLRGAALSQLPCIENAFLLIEDGIIADYGAMYELEIKVPQLPKYIIDAQFEKDKAHKINATANFFIKILFKANYAFTGSSMYASIGAQEQTKFLSP